jgi:hypothetical protein
MEYEFLFAEADEVIERCSQLSEEVRVRRQHAARAKSLPFSPWDPSGPDDALAALPRWPWT